MNHLVEPSLRRRSDNNDDNFPDFDYCAGCVIRKLRRERCMSGADVGYAMGYSQQQISRYERGNSRFTLIILAQFADVLGTNFWNLLDDIKLFYLTCCYDYSRQNNQTLTDRDIKWG